MNVLGLGTALGFVFARVVYKGKGFDTKALGCVASALVAGCPLLLPLVAGCR